MCFVDARFRDQALLEKDHFVAAAKVRLQRPVWG